MKDIQRGILAAVCAVVGFASSGADYHWTGKAGDHLWSTVGNWTDANGNPKASPPESGKAYSYKFVDYPDGLVVTQDINVAATSLSTSLTDSSAVRTLTLVSAPGKTFVFSGNVTCWTGLKTRLVLEVDMSADSSGDWLTKREDGTLVFKLKAANKNPRPLQVSGSAGNVQSTVVFHEEGCPPLVAVSPEAARGGFVNCNDDTAIPGLWCADLNSANSQAQPFLELSRTITDGHPLRVGMGYETTSTYTNRLYQPIFARGGSVTYRSERIAEMLSLPIGGTLALDRADFNVLDKPLTPIRWTFDDPANPTKDLCGVGARMLAPLGMPEVVDDPTRGKVIRFSDGKYFKGPDAEGGLDGLLLRSSANHNPYTVAFWLKPDPACDKLAKLLLWGDVFNTGGACALRLNVGMTPAKPIAFLLKSDKIQTPDGGDINLFDGAWHHVAVSCDGNNFFSLYLDGQRKLAQTISAPGYEPKNKNFFIGSTHGGWSSTGENPYTGLMDDLLVAACWMDEDQIAGIYRDGLDAALEFASVKANASGTAYLPARDQAIAKLSGEGLLGGVELRDGGTTLEVGAGGTSGRADFGASLRGGKATLVKRGADYEQVLSGTAANVTNLVVREGAMTVRRPLARQGLAVHYGFDDAGDLFRDDSVANLAMTVRSGEGVSAVADGVKGGAVRFAGGSADSDANFRPSNFPSGNADYTVSVWIRPTAAACAAKAPIVCWGCRGSCQGVVLRLESATELRFENDGEDLAATGLGNLADGFWHHVVAVYDAAAKAKYCYVDGASAASKIGAVSPLAVSAACPLRLATDLDGVSTYAGDLDELVVCDYAWTAAEAAAEHRGVAPAAVAAETLLPTPLAHWTFDNPSEPGADASGNDVTLTQEGSVAIVDSALACGKAAKIGDATGYFRLATVPASFPTGDKPVTVVCRFLPDTNQITGESASIVTWGPLEGWGDGRLFKIGMGTGRKGLRVCAAGTVLEGDYMNTESYRTVMGTERLRWLTVALVYSPAECGGKTSVWRVYADGREVEGASSTDGRSHMNLRAENFYVGNASDNLKKFRGLIDDIRVYDTVLSRGQVRLISEMLSHGGAVPKALPQKPSVTVAEDATLTVAANEEVASLAGAGEVRLTPMASLATAALDGFAGKVRGAGAFAVADNAVLALASDDLPVAALDGTVSLGANVTVDVAVADRLQHVFMTAGSFVGAENLSTWRVLANGVDKGGTATLSSDGKTLLVTPDPARGLIMVVR